MLILILINIYITICIVVILLGVCIASILMLFFLQKMFEVFVITFFCFLA
jgi:hypothetical protein